MIKLLPLALFLLVSCSNPLDGRGKLFFRDLKGEALEQALAKEEALRAKEIARLEFLKEKKITMEGIVRDAKESFEHIKPLIDRKCFDCHDANTRLPLYGRIFPGINPVHKHQVDGLKALDFSQTYPLKAQGNPPQLSLLKSIRNSVIERSMPLKSYRTIYRSRKITDEDQEKILAWVDPLIQRLEEYEAKYESLEIGAAAAPKIMEMKCFRCHANGNSKGGFGDMENKAKLLAGKFVNLADPLNSKLLTSVMSGEMPPNQRDALTEEELFSLREWLILETQIPR